MSPELAAVIVAGITAIPATIGAWAGLSGRKESREAKHEARGARLEASTAAVNSAPVADGFVADVRENLGEILTIVTDARDTAVRAEGKIDAHLEAHANGAVVLPFPVAREARQ